MHKKIVKREKSEEYIERIVVSLGNRKMRNNTKCEKIQFTGCGAQCGTTTVVSSIAQGLTEAGFNTLVIDCDFRKQNLDHKTEKGLGELLYTSEDSRKYVLKKEEGGFSYLPSGTLEGTILAAFRSERFGEILQRLSETFDYILLDVPSVNIVPEAELLMQYINGVVLVSRINLTKKKQISRAKEVLSSYGEQYYGMIINGMDEKEYHKLFRS